MYGERGVFQQSDCAPKITVPLSLPKTVLLRPSKESGIKDTQLRWFAGLQVTFGFTGYAELGDKLTLVKAQVPKVEPEGKGAPQQP